MTRKKKQVKKPTEDIKAVGNQNINYQGKIIVSLKRGNKTVAKKEYHNSGMPKLFRYLANVLAGNTSKELRPIKIKLFRFPGADSTSEDLKPENITWAKAWGAGADLKPVSASPFILYDTTPLVKSVPIDTEHYANIDENAQYSTTLHFRIPSSYISANVLHIVGLYPSNASDLENDVAAYFLFLNDTKKEWEPIVLDDADGNFSIIVEWMLTLGNKMN